LNGIRNAWFHETFSGFISGRGPSCKDQANRRAPYSPLERAGRAGAGVKTGRAALRPRYWFHLTKDEQGQSTLDSRKFLAENLVHPAAQFDAVLCWNLADYMDESLVKPVVGRLWSMLKPGGVLLAFFHTREAGPDAPCYRYHIVGPDILEMQHIEPRREVRRGPTGALHTAVGDGFRLQRVFNNRHIETLFRDFSSIKFFLTRDNIREVLVVR